jgi:glycine cleavage system H protein
VDGSVVEVNQALEDKPELVNKESYRGGWIAVLELQDPKQVEGLMTADQYRKHIGEA